MTVTGRRAAVRRLIGPLRRRVRLRTRLRRGSEAWRRRFPRPLPRWQAANPQSAGQPVTAVESGTVVLAPTAAGPPEHRDYGPPLACGVLSVRGAEAGGATWQVLRDPDRVPVLAGRVGEPIDARQAAVLARLAAVACPGTDAPLAAWAQLVAQLALTGVVLHHPTTVRPAYLDLLGGELAGLLGEPLPPANADPIDWEIRAIRQRRAVIRQHLGGAAQPPPVTAVLVSKRPTLVAEALAALAQQTYPRLEVVVGMHGAPAPAGLDAQVVPVDADQPLGGALAAATAAASGTLVTKVDDDDRYGPEHIWDLVAARLRTGATVTGKGAEFVYLAPRDITVRRRMAAETATDTVAGGTIALGRDELATLGGWPPVPHSVDRALLDAAVAAGASIYRTHPFGFVYTRHGDGHTWDPGLEYFLRDPVRRWRGLPPYSEFGTRPG